MAGLLGRGGDGCVAFHREKFQQYGPPSGGNGGRGGDVYIQPTSHLTTLSSVPRRIRGNAGGTGLGTFQNGRAGEPTIIRVPLGTIVRELPRDDPRRQPDEWQALEADLEGLDTEERRAEWRRRRFIHYPDYEENNMERAAFKDAIWELTKLERDMRRARRERDAAPLQLDLNVEDVALGVISVSTARGCHFLTRMPSHSQHQTKLGLLLLGVL